MTNTPFIEKPQNDIKNCFLEEHGEDLPGEPGNPAHLSSFFRYHFHESEKPVVGLDADGVLLNYLEGVKILWSEIFSETLEVRDPTSYRETVYFGIPDNIWLERQARLYEAFDNGGWNVLPELGEASNACRRLVDAGFNLVCVTSMPHKAWEHRLTNFRRHDFPIHHVVTCPPIRGEKEGTLRGNPKRNALLRLGAAFHVDDLVHNLVGLESVRPIFVNGGAVDLPQPPEGILDGGMMVRHLADFVDELLGRDPKLSARQMIERWDLEHPRAAVRQTVQFKR